ncbi:MAG: ATP-dependent Clp protease adaptor ClpS [Polyangiales bacterium]
MPPHDEETPLEQGRLILTAGPGSDKPPAPPPAPPTGAPDEDSDLAVEQVRKTQRPKRWKVIFHNDDYTTREFVIEVLMRFFEKDESEATFIMLSVHHKGHGVAGLYPKDVAETKVDKASKHARQAGMPLKVTAEPDD